MIEKPASLRSDVDSHPTGILIHITGIGTKTPNQTDFGGLVIACGGAAAALFWATFPASR